MADPTIDPNLIEKAASWAWTVIAGMGAYIWRSQGERFSRIEAEQARHRDVMAKLFDKLEAHGSRSEDRHRELLTALHEGLERKADKHV